VHIAPAFGTDDMLLGKKEKLPFVQHVKMDGTFTQENGEFSGLDLKPRAKDKPEEIREADLTIVRYLEQKGLLFSSEKYEHSYPHCWRCDTALLNYATNSWFVAVEKIKSKLLKTAEKINWSPAHIKEGRFGQWLAGARDWSISRQRFWANTIPVWRCNKCKKEVVFASADELEIASGIKVNDLHKDIVDEISFKCECGDIMYRIPDVLDTWFDSGSVPFASLHYPLENKNNLKKRLPADFIGEAQDQTRAWFYYQHVLVGALFDMQAFKNCIVTGIVLAEDGKKMSKKLKNYPDPTEVMEKYGADAMRFYMLNSPVVQAENLAFSEKGVDEIAKKNISRLYNVLSFYELYENGTACSNKSKNVLDRWIIARLTQLIKISTDGYESYKVDDAVRPLVDFIDDFSVWYLRRSRDRFKEDNIDKKDALATLRYVLNTLSKVIAPSMPFFAEYLFQKTERFDADMIVKMSEVRDIVNLALAERALVGIKVKQPLASLKIKNQKSKLNGDNKLLDLIKDEVNVKEIIFDSLIEKEVILDINITEELKDEGLIREIIRAVQEERKEQKLVLQDKISVWMAVPQKEKLLIEKNKNLLLKEFRAVDILVEEQDKIDEAKIKGKLYSIKISLIK
ncbi:MAG: class I tRNA ligase family protein, partial [Candidatus Staskawiczbacteria bacterium]|nr:class I tRNA ligase family protein [Candidatus Staskawiczbacteria bacterium]